MVVLGMVQSPHTTASIPANMSRFDFKCFFPENIFDFSLLLHWRV